MPSEAMSLNRGPTERERERSDGQRRLGRKRRRRRWLLAAPSLHSARRSNQRLVVGAELLRSSSPGDGSLEEELRGASPPLTNMALGMGSAHVL